MHPNSAVVRHLGTLCLSERLVPSPCCFALPPASCLQAYTEPHKGVTVPAGASLAKRKKAAASRLYLQLSLHWTRCLWPIIIYISKWILSKEMIHTNNNFVKSCGTLPDSGKSVASGSRLKYITATREILWVYYPGKVYCPGKLLLYETHAKLIL